MQVALPCDYTLKFRAITGWCNNLQNPHFGKSFQPFIRLLPAVYEDGKIFQPVCHSTKYRIIGWFKCSGESKTAAISSYTIFNKNRCYLQQWKTQTSKYRCWWITLAQAYAARILYSCKFENMASKQKVPYYMWQYTVYLLVVTVQKTPLYTTFIS